MSFSQNSLCSDRNTACLKVLSLKTKEVFQWTAVFGRSSMVEQVYTPETCWEVFLQPRSASFVELALGRRSPAASWLLPGSGVS